MKSFLIGLLALYSIFITTCWIKTQENFEHRLEIERSHSDHLFQIYQDSRWGSKD